MKRSFFYILLSATLLLTACAVDDDIYVDASDFGGYSTSTRGALSNYAIQIVDGLITASLQELEYALTLEENGTEARYFYDRDSGIPLSVDGSCWVLRREGKVTGLVMRKISGSPAWRLEYEGHFSIGGHSFPTSMSMTATKAQAASQETHLDWTVRFEGVRSEDEHYSCSFASDGDFQFKATTFSRWEVFGYEILTVFKRSKIHDKVVIRFNGGKSDVDFARIH